MVERLQYNLLILQLNRKRRLERRMIMLNRCGRKYDYWGENWLRYYPVAGFFCDGDETSLCRAENLTLVHIRNAGGIRTTTRAVELHKFAVGDCGSYGLFPLMEPPIRSHI